MLAYAFDDVDAGYSGAVYEEMIIDNSATLSVYECVAESGAAGDIPYFVDYGRRMSV